VSKIGEIYKITYRYGERYFQFVGVDRTSANGDTIVVFSFKGMHGSAGVHYLNMIIQSGIEFFTHTTVDEGVQLDMWEKVGRTKPVDVSDALFKLAYSKSGVSAAESSESDYIWSIWHVNDDWQEVDGNAIREYPEAEYGHVFTPEDVVWRIEQGRYMYSERELAHGIDTPTFEGSIEEYGNWVDEDFPISNDWCEEINYLSSIRDDIHDYIGKNDVDKVAIQKIVEIDERWKKQILRSKNKDFTYADKLKGDYPQSLWWWHINRLHELSESDRSTL
jgi:hypothetical protein